MAEPRTLGAPKEDDTLGVVSDALFGGAPFGLGMVPGIGRPMGAIGLASQGKRPSHDADRSALTGGFSRLGAFFDSLAARGVSVERPGSVLGAERPDITDPTVEAALDLQAMGREPLSPAMRGFMEQSSIDAAQRDRDSFGAFGQTEGSASDAAVGGGGGQSGAGADQGATGGEGSTPGGEFAEGGAVLVTKKMLKGPDPEGPDEGEIKMTVQEGEMVMVIPRDLVARYGPDKFKMLNKAMIDGLKQHMNQGMMRGKVSVKRASAL